MFVHYKFYPNIIAYLYLFQLLYELVFIKSIQTIISIVRARILDDRQNSDNLYFGVSLAIELSCIENIEFPKYICLIILMFGKIKISSFYLKQK